MVLQSFRLVANNISSSSHSASSSPLSSFLSLVFFLRNQFPLSFRVQFVCLKHFRFLFTFVFCKQVSHLFLFFVPGCSVFTVCISHLFWRGFKVCFFYFASCHRRLMSKCDLLPNLFALVFFFWFILVFFVFFVFFFDSFEFCRHRKSHTFIYQDRQVCVPFDRLHIPLIPSPFVSVIFFRLVYFLVIIIHCFARASHCSRPGKRIARLTLFLTIRFN